ncbi:hypothetical protein SNOG_07302 [Parastagonospora nodorum SN15]|uniref:Uncharacterized protein n=1 Tax=Phaeosphaeria nodorum (strain SN15 / ATCC MYA-4574 / FGSC 10173) TaxID=321614 RepID=Q0ULR2_PHANO|nr:hypothetical protein SNOG_07302 [Parastagonospora nodorum SN15]EAT84768.1 hypothetical protein SNOG_07302 [Parastagonospora nodorum SN15]
MEAGMRNAVTPSSDESSAPVIYSPGQKILPRHHFDLLRNTSSPTSITRMRKKQVAE